MNLKINVKYDDGKVIEAELEARLLPFLAWDHIKELTAKVIQPESELEYVQSAVQRLNKTKS